MSAGLIVSGSGSVQTSHEIPRAGNSQTLQDSTRYEPVTRSNSRGENGRLHQPSESNLDPKEGVESKSGRSRQRNRQGIRKGATDNAHGNREQQEGSLLSSRLRGNTNTETSASVGTDTRHSDSENVEARTSYSRHTEAPSKIRSRGREFRVSNTHRDVDGTAVASQTNDSDVTTESASVPLVSLPETSFTCADKIPGGYYADLEADCQLFHICSVGRHGR
jgi:hypothetical protein